VAHNDHEEKGGFFSSRASVVLIGFLAIAGFYLVTEHRAHVATAIPYLAWLLLLACPLMHMFMHRSHGGHGGRDRERDREDDSSDGRTNSTPTSPHRH